MNRFIVLDVAFQFNGVADVIHPVVLQDDKETILVDCGYVGFMPMIESALLDKNIDPQKLTRIVITHHDHDHMGSLADLKQKYPHIQVVASKMEAPYINGSQKSLRLIQAEAMQEFLSEEQKLFGEKFCKILRSVKTTEVDCFVKDGDIMDWCSGCEIIGTPGHTPGHISLYLPQHKAIITGDAISLEKGKPIIANPQFTLDKEQANHSFEKLLSYDADTFICYHGGIYTR